MKADATVGGCEVRLGMDFTGQTTDRLWEHLVPYPEGSWAHGGGVVGGGCFWVSHWQD